MRTGRVRRQRSIAQRIMLVIIAALTAGLSAVGAGLSGYLSAATDAGVRSTLASAPPDDLTYELSIRSGPDQRRHDSAVREHASTLLPGVAYELHRSVVTGPRTIHPPTDGESVPEGDDDPITAARAVIAAFPDLAEHAELVAGGWPDHAGLLDARPVAVHAGGAAKLDMRVGDGFSIADRGEVVDFVVTGLWSPHDPAPGYWGGEPLAIDGTTDHIALLAVAREPDLASVPGFELSARWRLEPDLAELTAADVAVLHTALAQLPVVLATDSRLASAQITTSGGLPALLGDVHHQVQAVRGVVVIPLALLGVAGIIAIALVAYLLVIRREAETELLRTRGAPSGLLARWALREALLVTIAPAAVGGGAAWLTLEVLDVGAEISPYAVGAGAGITAVLAAAAVIAVTLRGAPGGPGPAGPLPPAPMRTPMLVRAVIVASVVGSAWLLRRADTPLLTDAGGVTRIEPLAVLLPALVLLAGGLLGAVAVPTMARASQRLAARQRGLTGPLAVRQLARRPLTHALPVILVVIAIGTATLAAGFAATWSDLQERTAGQRTGADLQVTFGDRPVAVTDDVTAVSLGPYRTTSGVERVTPVVSLPLSGSRSSVELLAMAADSTEPLPGIDLPAGARAVSIELAAETRVALREDVPAVDIDPADVTDPAPARLGVDLWLVDADGQVATVRSNRSTVPVDAEADGVSSQHVVTASLPGRSGPWRVVAIELRLDSQEGDPLDSPWRHDYAVDIMAVRDAATGAYARLGTAGRWSTVDPGGTDPGTDPVLAAAPVGIGVRTDTDVQTPTGPLAARLLPATLVAMGTVDPLPIAATEAALAAYGLTVGDETTLRWAGGEIPVVVDDHALPLTGTTTDRVMTTDLSQLTALQLSTGRPVAAVNQLRLELDPLTASGVTATVTRLAGPGAVVLDRAAIADQLRGNAFAGPGRVAFWLVGAVAVVVAAVGLTAGAAAVTRRRAVEVAMLRSVGLSASQQSRSRRREQLLVSLSAIAVGAAVGGLVTALSTGQLARTVTTGPTESLHPVAQLALMPWLALVGGAVAAGVTVAIAHGSWVRRQALAATTPQHRLW
jgi:hypothetical protein